MVSNRYPLVLLDGAFAVCRLGPDDVVPDWAEDGPFWCVTKTPAELSIVCSQDAVPDGIKAETGWRVYELQGPVPFATVGVISSLTKPLAEAGISVFVVSTFDTDYLLVKDDKVARAGKLLEKAGFRVV